MLEYCWNHFFGSKVNKKTIESMVFVFSEQFFRWKKLAEKTHEIPTKKNANQPIGCKSGIFTYMYHNKSTKCRHIYIYIYTYHIYIYIYTIHGCYGLEQTISLCTWQKGQLQLALPGLGIYKEWYPWNVTLIHKAILKGLCWFLPLKTNMCP